MKAVDGLALMCAACDRLPLTRRHVLAGAMASLTMGGSAACASDTLVEPRLQVDKAGHGARPRMALTLDACSGHTDFALLDALIARRIAATLFVTGQWIERNPQAIARIKEHRDLFEIGNHGGRHLAAIWGRSAPFGVKAAGSPEAVQDEVLSGERAIVSVFGKKPLWFRGATALYSAPAVPLIAKMGYAVAGYSLNGDAGASLSEGAVTQRLERAQNGDVILAHLNHPERPCGKGLFNGLSSLQSQGVDFVHLDNVWASSRASQL